MIHPRTTESTPEPAAGATTVNTIFDAAMSGITHSQMYQAWVAPDLHPDEPQPRLESWHPEDLAAYCGGQFTN